MRTEPLTFACMSTPRLGNLQSLLPKVLPFVDKAIIVIGRSDEESVRYLKSLGNKVQIVFRPWDDSFSNQWNAYLPHVKEGWVLLCDDDEIPSDNMLKSLDEYINKSALGKNFSCIEIRCNPISEGQDMGPCNYYRQMLFRYQSNMKYGGGPKSGCHQYLTGYQNNRMIKTRDNEVYYHIKSLKDEHRNAARNYFIYGIWFHGSSDGTQMEDWYELKSVVAKCYPTVTTFMQLDDILIAGNIHQDLKNWMIKWWTKMNDPNEWKWALKYGHDGCPYNEGKALITYYF